ncbi:MAG TPA: FtsX-like permease family protein, partial [Spirochaetota bacterium]|nr:FtsX-like permease family protein [Spirochaetota bacterium]
QFAGRYKLKIGDEVSFFINDSQNNMMPYTFVVTGLLENRTGNNMEVESDVSVSPVVFVNYQYMADLLGVDEGMCTEVAVWDRNPEKLSRLASLAAQCGLEFGYADELYGVVGGITRFIGFLGVIIGILIMVVFSVATFNINIMSFMERRKEIGTMVAIGADPGKVVRLFMLEMAGFGVISFGVSLMMYASLGWFMSSGVNFGELGLLFSDKPFMFSVPAQSVLITGAILAAALFISVLYPLYLVYRIDPVEVFREVSI